MSKAFTRESDDAPDEPIPVRPGAALPPGAKNYLTPDGARRLQEELTRRLEVERPSLAEAVVRADAEETRRLQAQRLQALDQRVRWLQQCLQSAVVTAPPAVTEDRVRFGATVTVRERSGSLSSYRIVGVDETDIDRGWVSWVSPIARALLNTRRGQRVKFKFPSGEEELEIVEIRYEG